MSERIEFLEKKYTLIPEGSYTAVLAEIQDVGLQPKSNFDDTKVQKKVMWFQTEPVEVEEEGEVVEKRFVLKGGFPFPVQISPASNHFKIFIAPLLDKDEMEQDGVDIEDLVGRNLTVYVTHTENKGKTYANITSTMPIAPKKRRDLKVSEDYKPRSEDMEFPPRD